MCHDNGCSLHIHCGNKKIKVTLSIIKCHSDDTRSRKTFGHFFLIEQWTEVNGSSCQAPKVQIGSSNLSLRRVQGASTTAVGSARGEWVGVLDAEKMKPKSGCTLHLAALQKLPLNFNWGGINTTPLLAAPSHPNIHFHHCILWTILIRF